jgi:hypothetical protein
MPWTPYLPVSLPKGRKHCDECGGTGMFRHRCGGTISDDDFSRCEYCSGTGLAPDIDELRVAAEILKPEAYKELLGGYDGPCSLGVTKRKGQVAIKVMVAGGDDSFIPAFLPVKGADGVLVNVPVIPVTRFVPPTP